MPPPATVRRNRYVGPKSWEISAKGGLFFPTTVFPEGSKRGLDTDLGFITDLNIDFILVRYLTLGPYVSGASLVGESDWKIYLLSVGINLKFPIHIGRHVQFRPGLGVGLNILFPTVDFPLEDEVSPGFGINPAVIIEWAFTITDNFALLVEYTFISQPWGTIDGDAIDFAFPPVHSLLFGVELGS